MTPAYLPALSIGSTFIHQRNGLYSLNDLHQASGGEAKNRPPLFLENEQTKSLIAEILNAGIPAFKTTRGKHGGTYACRELVIAYAAWISAAFQLKVIRVFLDSAAPPQPQADKMSANRPAAFTIPPQPRGRPAGLPQPAELHTRIDDTSFLFADIQRLITRTLAKEIMLEATSGFANWRNKRWLLHLAGDDQGVLAIPRLTELPAGAQIRRAWHLAADPL